MCGDREGKKKEEKRYEGIGKRKRESEAAG